MTLVERLSSPGPKRILSLDGGGVRSLLMLGFLEQIEQILRDRHDQPDLRLCDYFDLIGGTSAGSILASALAIGMDVAEIRQTATEVVSKIFGKKKWKKWESLFDAKPLHTALTDVFGDRTLADSSIRSGLCILSKRADTRSTWPLLNHPHGKFYAHNKDILLRDAIHASAAAPLFFVPVKFDVGEGETAAFVDGAVSMANNPALQLFLVATLNGYPFHWPKGENKLLLVSVGTGMWRRRDPVDKVTKARAWDWTREVPLMLMEDASTQNQLILQALSRSPTALTIDSEIGDLAMDLLTPEPMLSYLRYNACIDREGLKAIDYLSKVKDVESLWSMSNVGNREHLLAIGRRAAEQQVRAEYFLDAFDNPTD